MDGGGRGRKAGNYDANGVIESDRQRFVTTGAVFNA
jgi:hypothetical protein